MNRTTTEKIALIVPRLASNHDGEVVASVRAIGRVLQSEGLDWHDLAEQIAGGSADPRALQGARECERGDAPLWAALSADERGRWIDRICTCPYVTEWEHGFAESIRQKYDQAPLTPKQQMVLNQIMRRAYHAGERI